MSYLQFEVGKCYRTRDGQKATIYLIRPGYIIGEIEGHDNENPWKWNTGGGWNDEPYTSGFDLVAEWREPARVRVTLWRNRQPAPCGRMYKVTLTDVIIPGCQWEVLDTFELVEGEGLKS